MNQRAAAGGARPNARFLFNCNGKLLGTGIREDKKANDCALVLAGKIAATGVALLPSAGDEWWEHIKQVV